MASSNIKLFDENKGNMLTDTEFSISNQRMNGLQTGVASSQLQNKAMYQASLVAYAIAQVMMQNGKNANDTDAVSAFVANLSGTMLQKVYDIATKAEAQAGKATGKWMSPALVKAEIDAFCLKLSGGTMQGPLTLKLDPTENFQAATKQYVDKQAHKSLYPSQLESKIARSKNGYLAFDPYGTGENAGYGYGTWQYNINDKNSFIDIVINVTKDMVSSNYGVMWLAKNSNTTNGFTWAFSNFRSSDLLFSDYSSTWYGLSRNSVEIPLSRSGTLSAGTYHLFVDSPFLA